MSSAFSFPILKRVEICTCLRELGIDIEEEELAKPKPDKVRAVYETLIEHCMGVTQEEINTPRFEATEVLQNAELHEESIPVVAFLRHVTKLLSVCGVTDSCLKDLTKPDAKRLVRNLSAIINFAKFREERLGEYAKYTEETEACLEERAAAEEQHGAALAKRKDVLERREAELPQIEALQAECASLEEQIGELNTQQAVLRHESNEVKQATAAIKAKIAETNAATAEAGATVAKLQSQIVSSPDRLKGELLAMADDLATEKAALEAAEAQRAEMAARLAAMDAAEEDLESATELVGGVEGESGRYKKCVAELKATQQRLDVLSSELEEKTSHADHLEKQVARTTERLKAFQPDAEVKTAAAERALEDARAELEQLRKEVEANRSARAAASDKRAAIVRKRMEVKQRHEAQVEEMMASFSTLRASVGEYHKRLLATINSSYPAGFEPSRPVVMPAELF
mmetsp:Transcript_94711/g.230085  ORF Transcript_94711/g.230085 Transcript_94711/m.230085 type:complete len:458 (-) Transcript_94711:126-1499(-)